MGKSEVDELLTLTKRGIIIVSRTPADGIYVSTTYILFTSVYIYMYVCMYSNSARFGRFANQGQ